MGADLREAVKNTTVNIIGEKGSAMYIGTAPAIDGCRLFYFRHLLGSSAYNSIKKQPILCRAGCFSVCTHKYCGYGGIQLKFYLLSPINFQTHAERAAPIKGARMNIHN